MKAAGDWSNLGGYITLGYLNGDTTSGSLLTEEGASTIDDFGVSSSSTASDVAGGFRTAGGAQLRVLPFLDVRAGLRIDGLVTSKIWNNAGTLEAGNSVLWDVSIPIGVAAPIAIKKFLVEPQLSVDVGVYQASSGSEIITERSGPRSIGRWPGFSLTPGLALGYVSKQDDGFGAGVLFQYSWAPPIFDEEIQPTNAAADGGVDLFSVRHRFFVGPYVTW